MEIKTKEEIRIIAEGGKILSDIVKKLGEMVRPGIETKELNKVAEGLVLKSGGRCSFKGYDGFPACLCTSINEEIVHAAPSERKLKEGDIISLDLGIFYKGFHSDMAITVPVGKISLEAKRLIEVTRKSLEIGMEKIKPGNRFGDISRVIQKYVEGQGFGVVRELCGHGIGKELHEDPQILNSVSTSKETVDKVKYQGESSIKLKEGMVFCIEPMITAGDWRIKKSPDGFGYQTRDNSLSAHFEHTIAVTKSGYQVLTKL
ncbi:MAG: type I methionyl aminopeptidase [Candidatus Nealsonbacteria bacterium RIFCSPLOWO2_01_FULL_41_9]|uniref:Methionine aminopeptidase n=1 Tax=Candidatus Nealsonbacteria bacterium RIFCSPLOWO2_01_FULL_41_9 TaxID=1801671 RepID=A0A1G2ECZ4_9BACT|nr:MAG: type I methionyl aminopeptidase [Candidatus Nealsonbacteria bacterium RIFCSPLOWO2_01_FULL_41_9]